MTARQAMPSALNGSSQGIKTLKWTLNVQLLITECTVNHDGLIKRIVSPHQITRQKLERQTLWQWVKLSIF